MAKVRVYELAKELGIEGKDMADKLVEMGDDVKSHSSSIEEDVADEVRQKLGLIETTTERKRIQSKGKTTIIRRRTTKKVAAEPEEPVVEQAEAVAEGIAEEEPKKKPVVRKKAPEEAVKEPEAEEKSVEEPAAPEVAEPVAAEAEPQEVESEPVEEPTEEIAEETEDAVAKEQPAAVEEESEPTKPAQPERRAGLARVIKKSAIVIPAEREKRPPRPRRVEKKGKAPGKGGAPAAAGFAKKKPGSEPGQRPEEKGKKGKRYVKFSPDPSRERVKKGGGGKRKGRVDVDMEDVNAFGGRLAGSLRGGGRLRHGGKKSQTAWS